MKLILKIFILTLNFCFLSCGQMRNVNLYEPSKSVSEFEKFPYKILFTGSEENGLWGLKNNTCKYVSFETTKNYIGKDHLYINWDASKCNYVAVGLKWSNYKVKNLEPIIESSAIELRVRIDSGEISNVPMFFVLSDYGGKQCRANINYLNLEGGKIDTVWRKIVVPLQAFNYKKRGVNMSKVKELRLEFQRTGDIHIDNIVIVQHNHDFHKTNDTSVKAYYSWPVQLGIGKEHWWGINTKYSSCFQFGESFTNESVLVDFKKSSIDPQWDMFGFSPYCWKRVDISSIFSTSAIKFKIKADNIPKIQAFIFSYKGDKRRIQKILNDSNFINKENGIYEAYLPLKSFADFQEFRWDELKEIRFKILEEAYFEIGEFQLIEFRGNPKKPTQWKGI